MRNNNSQDLRKKIRKMKDNMETNVVKINNDQHRRNDDNIYLDHEQHKKYNKNI